MQHKDLTFAEFSGLMHFYEQLATGEAVTEQQVQEAWQLWCKPKTQQQPLEQKRWLR